MREPEQPKEEEKERVEIEFDFEGKYGTYKWSNTASEFSEDVKKWYFVDNILTPEEKRKHLFTLDWTNPPIYAQPLKTEHLYMFGTKTDVYNSAFENITPVGEELDEYNAWVENLKQKYMRQKEQYFGGIKDADGDKKLIFNLDEKSIPIKKVERTKGIGGRACISYQTGVLKAFLEWLGGEFPKGAKNKPQQCMYLDLKVREAVLNGKEGIVWYTPEEWKVLSEEKKGLK